MSTATNSTMITVDLFPFSQPKLWFLLITFRKIIVQYAEKQWWKNIALEKNNGFFDLFIFSVINFLKSNNDSAKRLWFTVATLIGLLLIRVISCEIDVCLAFVLLHFVDFFEIFVDRKNHAIRKKPNVVFASVFFFWKKRMIFKIRLNGATWQTRLWKQHIQFDDNKWGANS